MSQKTNLNVSPYYDDFDLNKNFYKVLFNPGRAIQARELNTIQSILQSQVEFFGNHIFKDGSVVIPGDVVFDPQFYAVKLNRNTYGVDISNYIEQYIDKKITGQVSGITATIQKVEIPNNINGLEYITIYVKYSGSGNNLTIGQFENGESLSCNEDIVYGNTTILAGSPFASLISNSATSIGSAASIGNGIYYVRGFFVNVTNQTIILDYYSNTPSYRIGLNISEEIITSKEDFSLYDNAKGFTNYAAPGADRFNITLSLTKKSIDSYDSDVNFIELLKVEEGKIKRINTQTSYSLIRDYLAKRTFDESGNYSVDPFKISLHDSLNKKLGNDGLFFDDQKTDQGNTPNDDLMCIKLSPGKAYVRGYDIDKTTTTILDVEKPRDTISVSDKSVPFEMGNLLRVNNVFGVPKQNKSVELHSVRRSSGTSNPLLETKIGDARVYNFRLTDSAYLNQTSNWDLYLYDIQTYTKLTLNQGLTPTELPQSSFVEGKSSGASGYAVFAGDGSSTITLRQTSGTFIQNEQILINGIESTPRTISNIFIYNFDDVKQVYQSTAESTFSISFLADSVLEKKVATGFDPSDTINISGTTVTSASRNFSSIKPNSIIVYQRPGLSLETFNRVVSVNATGSSMTIASLANVAGICTGGVANVNNISFSLGVPQIRNSEKAYLYSKLPDSNISSLDLNSSLLNFTAQSNPGAPSPSGPNNSITVSVSNFSLPSGITTASFSAFDVERYSIHYTDGTTENLTSDKFSLSNNTVTFSNLSPGKTTSIINASFVKSGIQSKIKQFNRSKTVDINYSKYPQSGTENNTSINDGLDYNEFYGLRVQDKKICLKYPDVSKVLAVYESLDSSNPTLDKLNFSILSNIEKNVIVGENIIGKTSNAVGRVVAKTTTSVDIVYLNSEKFIANELVEFEESNIISEILSITLGQYNNITNKFTLDKGQKDQYYDYSSLIRNNGESEPSKKLLVVFDHYIVPTNDTGDVFTVLSYNKERFLLDIPLLGVDSVRATDTLDFRPLVPVFNGSSSSPYDFSSRDFSSSIKLNLSPDDNSIIGYNYYIGRIDKLYLDKSGEFVYLKGVSSTNPLSPAKIDDVMEIATISLPPYLYTTKDALISLADNRRYTMRDIGAIETRVKNLERVTSLSLLELNTQTLQIQDNKGLNRFKTGFFVDDFKDNSRIDRKLSLCEVDEKMGELVPIISRNSLKNYLLPSESLTDETIDLSTNYNLLDSNVQKTGETVTLKYESVPWISQLLSTSIENVNPFQIITYNGVLKLSPSSDTWVRTIQLPNKTVSITDYVYLEKSEVALQDNLVRIADPKRAGAWNKKTKTRASVFEDGGVSFTQSSSIDTKTDVKTSSQKYFVGSKIEEFMRSRNTEFSVSNLKPFTEFYQFLDGNSLVDYVPKLIEISSDSNLQNYGSTGSFQIGETVVGSVYSSDIGSMSQIVEFRVASPNHKYGPYNNPTSVYKSNPYIREETIPNSYSNSSKVLNVDTYSLSQESQGLYSGYIITGMRLVGKTSGAVAYVKNRRLVTDDYGDLIGTFFLKDPNTNPPPLVRINTGTKTFRISSSPVDKIPVPGDDSINFAETNYKSDGTLELYETLITNTNTVTSTKTTTTVATKTTIEYFDPLAQSFSVGGSTTLNNDENGSFLTAVDLFFYGKDDGNAPVSVQVRTVELGTPTRDVLGSTVTLRPDQVQLSEDGSVPTKIVFDYPIYLEPNNEYAIVILAPESKKYYVHIAEKGLKVVESNNLPNSSEVIYSNTFPGTLFKSQNGSVWTGNQNQDLKFKLYRAEFSTTPGTAYFSNPTLDRSNGYVKNLLNNPLTVLPRRVKLGITTTADSGIINILSPGRKVGESKTDYNYGYIIGTGCSASNVAITTGGKNYSATNDIVSTYNIVGNGSGLTLMVSSSVAGIITSSLIINPGNGYSVGDVVGIVTSSLDTNSGQGALFTVTSNGGSVDTLYLSNVQGKTFTSDGTSNLIYYDPSGTRTTLSLPIRTFEEYGSVYAGNFVKVSHFNHGMYAKNNKIKLSGVLSNIPPTTLSQDLTSSSTSVSVANTSIFGTFEGLPVGDQNPGYAMINNEIIQYKDVGTTTLETITRGIFTQPLDHSTGSSVFKYELNGVSLLRINTTHDISDIGLDIDDYYIEIDRKNIENYRTNRENDHGNLVTDLEPKKSPQLSFTNEISCGGSSVFATENIQYDSIIPVYTVLTTGAFTSVSAKVRTVSGTSVSGNETSFIDQGYEDVEINRLNKLNSTRIVCSKINEDTYLSNMPRNKSMISALTLTTTDKYLSPQIFISNCFSDYHSNRINSPILNYSEDSRVNSINNDPHAAIYVSNTVYLSQPATSLKVILAAYRNASSDFRVLYSLIRPDSSEIEQTFELFPGYDNLTIDNNNDGFLDVVDPSKNSGLPDVFVPPSLDNQFLEYEFSANNLGQFTGYTIKIVISSTDQSHPPRFTDLRTIATI